MTKIVEIDELVHFIHLQQYFYVINITQNKRFPDLKKSRAPPKGTLRPQPGPVEAVLPSSLSDVELSFLASVMYTCLHCYMKEQKSSAEARLKIQLVDDILSMRRCSTRTAKFMVIRGAMRSHLMVTYYSVHKFIEGLKLTMPRSYFTAVSNGARFDFAELSLAVIQHPVLGYLSDFSTGWQIWLVGSDSFWESLKLINGQRVSACSLSCTNLSSPPSCWNSSQHVLNLAQWRMQSHADPSDATRDEDSVAEILQDMPPTTHGGQVRANCEFLADYVEGNRSGKRTFRLSPDHCCSFLPFDHIEYPWY